MEKTWISSKIGEIANIQVARDLVEDHYSKFKTEKHKYPVYSNSVESRGLYGFYDFPEYLEHAVTVVGRGIGLGTAFARDKETPFGAIGRLIIITPKNNSFDVVFFAEYINFCLKIHNESGGIPQLPGGSLSKYYVTLPPLPEQKKIAQILSTWDQAITTTEHLIDLARQQKKALMQQLLTGKKRFPGFEGEWKDELLGNIAKITTGSSNRQDSNLNGQYTFFDRSEDIRTSDTFLFDCEAVIVPGEGQDFIPKYFVGKFDLHQRTYAIMDFPSCDGKFLYFLIFQFRSHFLSQAVGSTVKSLRLPMFQKMQIKLPSLQEQKIIAKVLTSADQEIQTLQSQLDGLKQEKKALMQALLTGKRRIQLN